MSGFFHSFKNSIENYKLPDSFDYPFYYTPHPIAKLACEELQDYLNNQTDFEHQFFNDPSSKTIPIGKMFGVLVCKNQNGEVGYLAAFSGKLANTNQHRFFVPPIFDMLSKDSFFLNQEERLNEINAILKQLESDKNYLSLIENLKKFDLESEQQITEFKKVLKSNKRDRKELRILRLPTLSATDAQAFEEDLIKQSLRDKHELRVLIQDIELKRNEILTQISKFDSKIKSLKEERKLKSNALQHQLFDQYQFLNSRKEKKGLKEIFENSATQQPPAAAGECAAPKLLQYAFSNDLVPICMAEFWWGDSPKSEIRKHKHYYPACTGKCEPILGHMLAGVKMDENPLIKNFDSITQLDIIYEDNDLVVVNKPENFLSVPGITMKDSVYQRIKDLYPLATGPLIIHRLDMATSGLLVIALNKKSHKNIQDQFIKRFVKKRYIALLDGEVNIDKGKIILPIRVDLDDRPRQVICYEYGKHAETYFEVIERKNGKTLINFYPITGRTHQLRVHASHQNGLNAPIKGDDLYGSKSDRLYLHAEFIEFYHPTTKELVQFKAEANFKL